MIVLNDEEVRANLPWLEVVDAVGQAVLDRAIVAPPRLVFDIDAESSGDQGHLLIMPSWRGESVVGLKTLTIWPHDPATPTDVPSHGGNYLLIDARSGSITAVLDAAELTARRTAAVSVLAARQLMRRDARHLLVIGTGPVAHNLVLAHTAMHAFDRVEIYGRNPARAQALAADLAVHGILCSVSADLASSAAQADVIVSATSARSPVLHGEWLTEGTHVDLIGGYKPYMREADDTVFARAAAIWIDNETALRESGDLLQPIAAGVIAESDIRGDLRTLLSGQGRRDDRDITVFKSVGFAVPDLAAAQVAVARAALPAPVIAKIAG